MRYPRRLLPYAMSLAIAASLVPAPAMADEALQAQAGYSDTLRVTDGSATVNGDIVTTNSEGIQNQGTSADSSATVNGSVEVNNPYWAYGVDVLAERSREYTPMVTTNVQDDVTVTGGLYATGVQISNNYAYADATIGGDVSASARSGDAMGVCVDVDPYTQGVYSYVGGRSAVSVEGDVHATARSGAARGIVLNKIREADIVVGGDVIATTEDGRAQGVMLNNASSTYNVEVEGDVRATSSDGGEGVGILINADHLIGRIAVDGTVEGSTTAIRRTSSASVIPITAWRVVPNEQGNLAEVWDAGAKAWVRDDLIERYLMYLARWADELPQGAGTVTAAFADNDWTLTQGSKVGAGERLRLTLNLNEGWYATGVWADADRTLAMEQAEDGTYYATVPRGGGVFLNADVINLWDLTFFNGDVTQLPSTGDDAQDADGAADTDASGDTDMDQDADTDAGGGVGTDTDAENKGAGADADKGVAPLVRVFGPAAAPASANALPPTVDTSFDAVPLAFLGLAALYAARALIKDRMAK